MGGLALAGNRKHWHAIEYACALLVFCAASSPGSILRVPSDHPTIQAGINEAGEGDTVLVAPGKYAGLGNRDLNFAGKGVSLISEAGPDVTVIDCEGQGRGFIFDSGESASTSVRGFSVVHGSDRLGCGMYCGSQSSPTLVDMVFRDNSPYPYAHGGGAYCEEASSPRFRDSRFEHNVAHFGAGIACEGESSPVLQNVVFFENEAADFGGGVYCHNYSSPVFKDVQFVSNTAHQGGAVFCSGFSSPVFTRVVFSRNSSVDGGGVHCSNECLLTMNGVTMAANEAARGAGILCWTGSEALISNSIIAFSVAGEAVWCGSSGVVQLTCSDIFGNAGGDWTGCIEDQMGVNGNMCDDPRFCVEVFPDTPWFLQEDSPCTPGGNPFCGLIGARGVGCGASPMEAAGWGAVKALFR